MDTAARQSIDAAADLAQVRWPAPRDNVRCPLCEYDLRGLTEPRCPECGYKFRWEDLLDPTKRRHPFLFEHYPSRNIWSFYRTLTAGLWPRRFWTSLYPTQPSFPDRLFVYAIVVVALGLLAPAAQFVHAFVWSVLSVPSAATPWTTMARTPLDAVRMAWNYSADDLAAGVACYVGYAVATYLSLLVFRISMRRARIKTVHVARCVVYSFDALVWAAAAVVATVIAEAVLDLAGGVLLFVVVNIMPLASLVLAFVMPYRLYMAYRHYLQFDHPFLTVFASQVIALLAIVNVMAIIAFWDTTV